MRNIKQLKKLAGQKALVRVDFNVSVRDGKIADDFRIRKALPTIKFLLGKGAKVILLTHLGKDGKEIEPVIKHFFKISKFPGSKVSFLDNIRKFKGEAKNDLNFAKKLSTLGDIYVNEAFSASHRAHASIVGLPKLLPSYAGLQFMEEMKNLSRVLENCKHPFLFILGGAKFSTKMPLIKKYLKLADHIFIGGALANNFLKAKGYEIGQSLLDYGDYEIKEILENRKVILPADVIVERLTNSAIAKNVNMKKINEVEKDEIILDIGNETVKNLARLIKKSKLILWNGPLGKYESGGEKSTKKVLKLVATAKTKSVIGGGDTVEIISKMKMEKDFSFVSTGGGAMLDFLANGTLPGIEALK